MVLRSVLTNADYNIIDTKSLQQEGSETMQFFNDIYRYQDLRVDKLQHMLAKYLAMFDELVKHKESDSVSPVAHPKRKRKGVKPLHHPVDELKIKVGNLLGSTLQL